MSRAIRSVAVNALWLLVALAGLEALYRVFLYFKFPDRFIDRRGDLPIDAYSKSMWRYDSRFGYSYEPVVRIATTSIKNGRVISCQERTYTNEQGNIGPSVPDFPAATYRIVVIGDSYSASTIDGKTWPSILQSRLVPPLGKSVRVLNLGRDGYGLPQMFDLAAGRLAELKPTLVVIAFNSGIFFKDRTWRVLIGNGDDVRLVSTKENSQTPDLSKSTDVHLLMPSATKEWCDHMMVKSPAEQSQDVVLKRIVHKDEFLRRENPARVADIWDLKLSYAYNRIVHNDQFHSTTYRSWVERPSVIVPYDDFKNDQAFVRAVKTLNSSRIPYIIVNLPMGTEVKAGEVPIIKEPLARSLERVTGHPVMSLLPQLSVTQGNAMSMCVNVVESDCHPTVFGMTEYANAVGKLIHAELPVLRFE